MIKQLQKEKLLPLYTVKELKYLDKLEEVLLENDINFIEITYRSNQAAEAINYLANKGNLTVGAGTIRNLAQAKDAVENGAQFIVTPGISETVLKYCNEKDVLVVPGAVTPSEIITVMEYNIKIVKFFPANIYGGLNAIESLNGPFADIRFVPTGGVNKNNFLQYLSNESVLTVGGSFIISEGMIAKDNGKTAAENLSELNKLIEKSNKII